METQHNTLKTNIGFMLNKPIGYSRDFQLAYEAIRIQPDLDVKDLASEYRLSRTQEGLLFQGTVSGVVDALCVRCLESAPIRVEAQINELYFFPDHANDSSEQMIPEDGYIDLGETFRDYLLLELPIQNICKPDCKGVCIECGHNLNFGECEHTDSRVSYGD